jgi:chromosome transmission fidelity protein 1
LSLLCAALKWLDDHRDEALDGDEEDDDDNDDNDNDNDNDNNDNDPNKVDDWVSAHFKATRAKAKSDRLERRNAARRNERMRLNELRTRQLQQLNRPNSGLLDLSKRALPSRPLNSAPTTVVDDGEFLLLEPNNGVSVVDNDAMAMTRALLPDATSSAAMRAVAELLATRAKKRPAAGALDEPDETFEERKVYYCARTHSQLSQFIDELRRTAWVRDLKCIPLGARKNLCVNESVTQLRDATQINDKCDELRRGGQCPYVVEQPRVDAARDAMLATQPDIEAALEVGSRNHACAYYAARAAVPHAELIVLPYQLVVQKEAREALGLQLRGNIVILDECHNVASAIASSHESELDAAQLDAAHSQLDAYLHKYATRLSAVNVNSVRQLLFVCRQLTRVLGEASAANESSLATLAAFVFRARIDNLNLFELERYFAESQVVRKVQGFARLAEQQAGAAHSRATSSTRIMWSLAAVRRFLVTLTASEADARVLVGKSAEGGATVLRCVMLSAARPCLQLCVEARAVAFCGGTVAPRNAFLSDLFGERVAAASDGDGSIGEAPSDAERAAHERLRFFSCGHVVPRESVILSVLPKGPTGVSFNFAFAARSDERRVGELGAALVNLCAVVPHGVVVFFTSYAYEAQVVDAWTRSGVMERLASRKVVHRDRRTRGNDDSDDAESDAVSALLTRYAADARSERGALLTAVMGGRLSEGINFKDELARCVVVVGVPFPPANDVLFDEKVRRASAATKQSVEETRTRMMNDVAMKTVNQAIGRALRHRGDFAAIVLADERFERPALRERLPQWLAASMLSNNGGEGGGEAASMTYGTFTKAIAQFFRQQKTQKTSSLSV